MEIRQAILKAADHIEANPGLFDFRKMNIPAQDCGTPGCALGWIGAFLGVHPGEYVRRVSQILFNGGTFKVYDGKFYTRMSELSWDWPFSPIECAQALRQYANKYHPETPEQFPEVRRELDRIFDGVAA